MIDKNLLLLMKDKYFVNTARGELIDEEFLLKIIQEDFHFKGLALDVFSDETKQNNINKFIKLSKNNNLILTPHVAGATFESMVRTEEFLVEKLALKIEFENHS